MRRPPRAVKVLGQRVETRIVSDMKKATGEAEKELVGHIIYRFGLAFVSKHQSQDQLCDTWLHEMLHAMLWAVGEDSEETVGRLAPVLLDFLRSNPRAVEFLTGRKLGVRLPA